MRAIVIEIMKYACYAACVYFVIRMIYIIYDTLNPHRRKSVLIQKGKKYQQKYKTEVWGEVIGYEKEERVDWLGYFLSHVGPHYSVEGPRVNNYKYFVYSPIIRYEVMGFTYEINSGDYNRIKPIVGRKALVVYNDWNPEDACVQIKRKYRKHLKIRKRDEEYVYCAYGLKKNIRIPIAETEERAVPGRFLVHKYGFYHLEQPEEIKKSFVEMMENPLLKKRDEYKDEYK